ncbi:MAG: ROK family protein [Janthinobacterium lividum]
MRLAVSARQTGESAGSLSAPGLAVDGYLAAVDIGGTRVRMMLAHANGTPAAYWDAHIAPDGKAPQDVVALVGVGLRAMVATVPAAPLLHITVGAPGITDPGNGTVLEAPNLPGWTNVPLAALLQTAFGVPAAVDNDTNLAALGEHAAGVAQGVDDFVFIAMGTGVGAGLVLGGKVHRGKNGSAGEIGYLPLPGAPRQPVRMRETGQLERSIGGLGIEARWQESLAMSNCADAAERKALRAPQIFDLAEGGDPLATEVLQWTARLLADALCTLTLVLDPAMIVLGGGVGSHPHLCAATANILRENDFPMPVLRSSSLGTQAQLFGAVAVSLAALDAARRC